MDVDICVNSVWAFRFHVTTSNLASVGTVLFRSATLVSLINVLPAEQDTVDSVLLATASI